MLNFNIRSFNSNISEFVVFLDDLRHKPDIFVLTETWFDNTYVGIVNGYTGFHYIRGDRRGEGVSIYVSQKLDATITRIDSHITNTM